MDVNKTGTHIVSPGVKYNGISELGVSVTHLNDFFTLYNKGAMLDRPVRSNDRSIYDLYELHCIF